MIAHANRTNDSRGSALFPATKKVGLYVARRIYEEAGERALAAAQPVVEPNPFWVSQLADAGLTSNAASGSEERGGEVGIAETPSALESIVTLRRATC
ncbi:hypothetical protein KM043_008828 [Ampulex compressa]|nr:hypothetical protein KM043_008828 [Ampulex compressa]